MELSIHSWLKICSSPKIEFKQGRKNQRKFRILQEDKKNSGSVYPLNLFILSICKNLE
jgi:hypothetical protein